MTERIQIQELRSVGYLPDETGRIVERDLMLKIGGNTFILAVATPERMAQVIGHNENHPPEQQIDDNLLVVPGVRNLNDLGQIRSILTQMSLAVVEPFLVEQKAAAEPR